MSAAEKLRTAGTGPGDEVIVSAFGDAEWAEAVVLAGAVPVFADIDPVSYCLDAAAVEAVVTARTAAVVVVHRFGRQADLGALQAVGARHGLLVLEQDERPAVPYGHIAFRRAQAAYLNGKLTGVRTPDGGGGHTYGQYVVRVPGNGRPDRDAFARALRVKGVACRVPVPVPVHRLPEFRRPEFVREALRETESAADETLALELDQALTKRDLQRIAAACNALGGLLTSVP
jgi:dTDP-4-amino-4,6-dideoxygalactose transaminase